MGRHKQIESILLQELTSNEERSQRIIQILNYQRSAIYTLQKELEQKKKECHDSKAIEEYEYSLIQQQVISLRATLHELKAQQQILKERSHEADANDNANSTGKCMQETLSKNPNHQELVPQYTTKPHTHTPSPPPGSNLSLEIESIYKSLETRCKTETDLRLKVEMLLQKVSWLKKERDDVISHIKEQLEWRQRVEMQLRDLSSGFVNEKEDKDNGDSKCIEFGDMTSRKSRNAWRIARQFFSAEESQFFLTPSKKL